MKRSRGDACKWRCRGSPRDNERHGLFILSRLRPPAPPSSFPSSSSPSSSLRIRDDTQHTHAPTSWQIESPHKHTFYWLPTSTPNSQRVCVRRRETRVKPITPRFLSGSGRVSTNHKVNIGPAPALPVHLLNSPIKAELKVYSQRSRIYLSCSNWLIVAVLGRDWVVHHVPTEGCRRGRSRSHASKIAPRTVRGCRGF